jgi:DNA-binding transcriptional MerR regulator
VAQATGVPAKTIRYYEHVGVLPAAGRTRSGYRQYTERGVHRLRFIRRARALGLPLRELKTLATALDDAPGGVLRPRLLDLARAQLRAVQKQMTELEVLHRELEEVVRRLRSRSPRTRSGRCRCLETA